MHTNPGVYALLLGSGVSRSAGIPTGWEVTMDLIKRLAVMDGQSETEDLEAWYRTKYSEEPGYSAILARLSKTSPERRAILQGFFEPTDDEKDDGLKLPTLAHRSIARLVSQGFIRVILTTNFDRLMETALSDEGVAPVVISTDDALSGAAPLTHQKCVIVKLHGETNCRSIPIH
jgi:NAD-dependent SIR2 family protein deacetylase